MQQGPPRIFDRKLYLARVASARGEAHDLLQKRIAEELSERLAALTYRFENTLLIASSPQLYQEKLLQSGKCAHIVTQHPQAAEDLALPAATYDAVFSLLDLHTVNDVPGYLAQVAESLKPDGLAMLAFFAGDTLKELREAFLIAEQDVMGGVSPRVAPMIDLREAGALLQRAGLALPVADMDRVALRYGEALALMRDVKSLGFSNCLVGRKPGLSTPHFLFHVAHVYAERFADKDGRLPATLEIAWATAWKPHPSQQKPLKPGSAKARLADALKVRKP